MTDTEERPTSTAVADHPERDDWVPADERVAGFDRRTIWPGLVLLAVWAIWGHVMPWIDRKVEVDNPVAAGDVVNLGMGEVTFLPAEGWDLVSGTLVEPGEEGAVGVPASAVLSNEVVAYQASSGNWDGTADSLLEQMIDVNVGLDRLLAKDEQGRVSITNADGVPGRLSYVSGIDGAALITTFVFDRPASEGGPIGVEIEVSGTPASLKDNVREIATMIETTTYRPADGEED